MMPRKSYDARIREQRVIQQKLRDADKQARRPGRDDIARVALYWLIRHAYDQDQIDDLDLVRDNVVSLLAEQGFDEHASDTLFDELVAKYRTGGLPFRRKAHVLFPDGPDHDD